MLIEKEVIRPGTYWYTEEGTGLPRKLVVTPEFTKHLHDQGNAMIGAGLSVPVPYEHDFSAHPMTPKDKLLNNAGEVKQYTLKGDTLFSTVDVQDPAVKDKIGRSIRWTSPWINSFTDGSGKKWENVISHLALTTRPRVTKQEPFSSIAAALSMATDTSMTGPSGICLSRAGRLFTGKVTNQLRPRYPIAFSLWGGGIKLSDGDMPFKKKRDKSKDKQKDGAGNTNTTANDNDEDIPDEEMGEDGIEDGDASGMTNPLADASGDVKMEEILCDLLQALGVPMPDDSNEAQFKRHLYEAAMCKIKDLASKGDPNSPQNTAPKQPGQNNPNSLTRGANPLIEQVQQEQQPMYMSLEEINKIEDQVLRNVALSMYAENKKQADANSVLTAQLSSLRDKTLREEQVKRQMRIDRLKRISPSIKADLDAMLALPSMALSMGDGGAVMDPMSQTLGVLEKGLADMPRLLMTDTTALSISPQPKDADELTAEKAEEIADSQARMMGCPPQAKAS